MLESLTCMIEFITAGVLMVGTLNIKRDIQECN